MAYGHSCIVIYDGNIHSRECPFCEVQKELEEAETALDHYEETNAVKT